jgi:hypothetical protein
VVVERVASWWSGAMREALHVEDKGKTKKQKKNKKR